MMANIIGIDCCAQSAFIRLNRMKEEKKTHSVLEIMHRMAQKEQTGNRKQ